ncbi:hypothetical protein M885DRAFT_560952, partial [Pelagophyceae sp. CCMP2097]
MRPRTALARRLPPVCRFAARGPMAEAALVVRNLPKDATAHDVRKAFEPFCDVTNVKVDGVTGQGVVTIETAEPEVGGDFNNVNFATSLHRLGVLGPNACWGIAKIGNVEAPALFEAVAAEASKKIATFDPQNLANIVWAYATVGVKAPALFEAVATESSKKIATFVPQDLVNTVWAYATAGVEAPALFEA